MSGSTSLQNILKASLESLAEGTDDGVVSTTQVEGGDGATTHEEINPLTNETSTSLDEALEQASEAAVSANDAEAAVQTLQTAGDGVERVAADMEAWKAKHGSISLEAYGLFRTGIQNAIGTLPIPLEKVTVSNERFEIFDADHVSMEAENSAKQLLTGIWEAVKNAVLRVVEAVKNWVSTFGKGGDALINAGALVKKKAAEAKGKTAKSDKIAGNKLLSTSAGTFDPLAALPEAWKVGDQVGAWLGKLKTEFVKGMAETARVGFTEANGLSFDQEFIKATTNLTETAKALDGVTGPGGAVFAGSKVAEGAGRLQLKFDGKTADAGEVDVLTPDQLNKLGEELIVLGRFVKDFDKKYFKDFDKTLSAELAKLKSEVGKDLSKGDAFQTKLLLKLVQFASSNVKDPAPQYVAHAAKIGKAAYAFAGQCLKQYGAAPEAAAQAALPAPAQAAS